MLWIKFNDNVWLIMRKDYSEISWFCFLLLWFVLFSVLLFKLIGEVIVWFWLCWLFLKWSWLNLYLCSCLNFCLFFCLSFLLFFTLCCCCGWFFFFLNFKWLRDYMHDKWWSWLKLFHILFFIETICFSEFFINNLIITFLIFSFFDCFCNPSAELEMLSIRCCIESEFEKFLALPELRSFNSFDFSHFRSDMILVFVIIVRYVFTIMSCISVFIKNEFAEIIVFKNVLSVRTKSVVHRNHAFSKSMNNPFWL